MLSTSQSIYVKTPSGDKVQLDRTSLDDTGLDQLETLRCIRCPEKAIAFKGWKLTCRTHSVCYQCSNNYSGAHQCDGSDIPATILEEYDIRSIPCLNKLKAYCLLRECETSFSLNEIEQHISDHDVTVFGGSAALKSGSFSEAGAVREKASNNPEASKTSTLKDNLAVLGQVTTKKDNIVNVLGEHGDCNKKSIVSLLECLKCTVCLENTHDATVHNPNCSESRNDSHTICSPCFERLPVKYKSQPKLCPTCKFAINRLMPLPTQLRDAIDQLTVRCPDEECNFQAPLQSIDTHITSSHSKHQPHEEPEADGHNPGFSGNTAIHSGITRHQPIARPHRNLPTRLAPNRPPAVNPANTLSMYLMLLQQMLIQDIYSINE